jgi:hypothetical protein
MQDCVLVRCDGFELSTLYDCDVNLRWWVRLGWLVTVDMSLSNTRYGWRWHRVFYFVLPNGIARVPLVIWKSWFENLNKV